jgi:hypothetical protein
MKKAEAKAEAKEEAVLSLQSTVLRNPHSEIRN